MALGVEVGDRRSKGSSKPAPSSLYTKKKKKKILKTELLRFAFPVHSASYRFETLSFLFTFKSLLSLLYPRLRPLERPSADSR